ncbi:MAG: 50S ribosomal protein L16 3-hydroxylase [Pseudohongiellaceae bacterium]|jgi:50S ribosomal protein L16 3-hydroxylase
MKTLQNFNAEDFLKNYWQNKPLLIRNALPDFQNPLSPDELAGLACEEAIESRLITGTNQDWQLTHGPLDDHHFEALPEHNWTLLVQAVDQWMPEVSSLIDHFNFIPFWRIDDVMVSYASDGGSVGPHYDNYDVFLIQGLGQRRWKLGQFCESDEALLKNTPLKILQNFETTEEWVLNPGDILYVPPRYAHWGTGEGEDCMTYSVGFRAPDHSEILSHFCDHQLAQLTDQQRYQDPTLSTKQAPGEINADAIANIQDILKRLSDNPAAITEWFGQYMTEPKYPHLHDDEQQGLSTRDIEALLHEHDIIYRNPASRLAYNHSQNTHCLQLFVDGKSQAINPAAEELAKQLCNEREYSSETLLTMLKIDECNGLISHLFNIGILYCYELNHD